MYEVCRVKYRFAYIIHVHLYTLCIILLYYSATFYSTLIGSHTDVDWWQFMSAMQSMQLVFSFQGCDVILYLIFWLYIRYWRVLLAMSSPHHELSIFGMVLPATFFPGHGLLTSVAYSSSCVQMHTYTILFYKYWRRPPKAVNAPGLDESQTSHGVPPRAIPVNIGVRSPPLLVLSSTNGLFLLART